MKKKSKRPAKPTGAKPARSPAPRAKSAAKTAARKPLAARRSPTRAPTQAPIHHTDPSTMVEVSAARDLFWQNVIRQILASLSVEWMNRNQHQSRALPPGAPMQPPEASPPPQEDLFDGRLGILTHAGERIPIAQVFPVLACGLGKSDESKVLSMAVECSVFQVRTPTGEVFTLPLSEMRGFHSLTPELMQALEEAARRDAEPEDRPAQEGPGTPFGFAAFTSLERAGRESRNGTAYPQHPPDAPNPHPEE